MIRDNNPKRLYRGPILWAVALFFLIGYANAAPASGILHLNFNDNINDDWGAHTVTDGGSLVYSATFPTFNHSGSGTPKAGDFEATDSDYIYVDDASDLSFTDGAGIDKPFTICVWWKMESTASNREVVAKYHSVNGLEYAILLGSDDKIYFNLYTDGSNSLSAKSDNTYTDTTAYHQFCFNYDGSEAYAGLSIYYDTATVATSDASIGSYTGMSNTASDVYISSLYAGSQVNFYDGLMDELKIFNKSLSEAEIIDLFNCNNILGCLNATNFTTITAKDVYNGSDILSFNVTLTNSTGSVANITQDGSAVFANLTGLYNLTFMSSGYFTNYSININTSLSPSILIYAIPSGTILEVLYSNFIANDSYNYTSNFTYSINASCSSEESTYIHLFGDGNLLKSSEFICINESVIRSFSYVAPTEGTKFYQIKMNSSGRDYGNISRSNFTFDLFAPNITISYHLTPQFSTANASINITCQDSISGYLNYNVSVNANQAVYLNLTKGTVLPISHEVINGNNSILGICTDIVDHTVNKTESAYFYIGNLTLVEESTGAAYNVSNLSRVIAYIENGTTYDFKALNSNTVLISSGEENTKIRVELEHTDGTVITRHFDWELVEGNAFVCANYDEQTYNQQIIVSATQKAVFVINTFTDCYLDADYTRFAYEDALILPSYTIESLYYLKTYVEGEQIILASLDGSISANINLDQLEFNRLAYNLNILGETLVIQKTGHNEITIYFQSLSGDNEEMDLSITNVDTGDIYLSISPENPNNFTVVFDYSLLSLTNESLLLIQLDTEDSTGQTNTIKRYFTPQAINGSLPPVLVITISLFLMLFGLTLSITRLVFSWLGIFICLCSIAILSLGIQEWYVIYVMGLEFIILIFIVIKMVLQNYPEVA